MWLEMEQAHRGGEVVHCLDQVRHVRSVCDSRIFWCLCDRRLGRWVVGDWDDLILHQVNAQSFVLCP